MNSSFLKLLSPKETKNSKYYSKIKNSDFKVLGSPIYILDWTFIFEQIDKWKKKNKKFSIMIDVGCGNGMFHIFLEKYYKQGIIGIERQDSRKDYKKFEKLGHFITNATDISIDFISDGNKFFNKNIDVIFWISAIEHNKIKKMQEAVNVSMKLLKKGGIFISTWAYSPKTHWNNAIGGTVLDEKDASKVFGSNWIKKPNFEKIKSEYNSNILNLKDWHKKRFGKDEIDYIHAGNVCVKK